MTVQGQPRRANLPTIVGSSLAVVAAGSLLAFSLLAEQAGLEGLATGGLQPTRPGRSGGGAQAITIPAPTTDAPRDPRDVLAELVRDSVRDRVQTLVPVETSAPAPPQLQETDPPETPRRIESRARVAVAPPGVDGKKTAAPEGPPYGHAYGHEKKHKGSQPGPKGSPNAHSDEQPGYARSTNQRGEGKPSKGPKPQKADKGKGHSEHGDGKGKGHSEPAHGKSKGHSEPAHGKSKGHSGHGNGKAKGHAKHAHKGKGKGKGHSKHGG